MITINDFEYDDLVANYKFQKQRAYDYYKKWQEEKRVRIDYENKLQRNHSEG